MAGLAESEPQVEVTVEGEGTPRPVLCVAGELDTATADIVADAVTRVAQHRPECIVFDLGALTFMDSSGLAVLLGAKRQVPVELRRLPPAIRRVLEASGLEEVFELSPTTVRRARRFPPVASSVSAARRFVTEELPEVPAGTLDALAVMVSELATNAVQHSGSTFEVCLELAGDALRVEVSDGGQGRPQLRHPSPQELRGRGLQIVRSLSDDWGSTEPASRGPGKAVWFELRVPSG